MARPLRIEYPGAFYHVMNRGHRGEPIVLDDRDRQRFLVDLERMVGRFAVQILAHGRKRNDARDVAIYLARELSGSSCRELGRYSGGVSGAAITMRHSYIAHRMAQEHRLARQIARVRRRIVNA